MENTLQLLTGKQAAQWLNLSYETFIKEVRKGAIGYKIVGSVRRYPLKALEEWLNNTMFHFEYTSVPEDRATTHTSRTFPKQETEYSLESLLEERQRAKQMHIALKDWHKSNKNNANKQTAKSLQ
jgi:excisionase family DNA binding protein